MPSLIFRRNNKYWNNFPETQFITLKKIKEGESGKKSIFYLKERERERDQKNRPNLKTPAIMLWRIQPGNRIDRGEDGTWELLWQTVSYPPLQRGKIFPFPGFSPSFTAGLIDTRETFILAQIKKRFWSSPQCPIFPQLREGKKKKNLAFGGPWMNKNMDLQNTWLHQVNKTHFENDANEHD